MKKNFSVGNERQNVFVYWRRIPLRKNKSQLSLKTQRKLLRKAYRDSLQQLVERQVAKRKN